jgi:hypothetical protein
MEGNAVAESTIRLLPHARLVSSSPPLRSGHAGQAYRCSPESAAVRFAFRFSLDSPAPFPTAGRAYKCLLTRREPRPRLRPRDLPSSALVIRTGRGFRLGIKPAALSAVDEIEERITPEERLTAPIRANSPAASLKEQALSHSPFALNAYCQPRHEELSNDCPRNGLREVSVSSRVARLSSWWRAETPQSSTRTSTRCCVPMSVDSSGAGNA